MTSQKISKICQQIEKLLLEKNRKYGDNYNNPVTIFSKLSALDRINSRLDEKLGRIKNLQEDDIEDTELDIIGLLILKQVIKK